MKPASFLSALVVAVFCAQAQEKLSRDECLKYAFVLSANLKDLLNTPIPTDPDIKRPSGIKDEGCGAMVLPETKLGPQTLAGLADKVVPLGQLWLARLVPASDGKTVAREKLRLVHVTYAEREMDLPCLALGAQKKPDGGLELLVYGKSPECLLRLPLKPLSSSVAPDEPIELVGEHQDDSSGLLKLRVLGKYEAVLPVHLAGR